MTETAKTILLTIFGSGAFFAFLQFLITRYDSKKGIRNKVDKLEKDGLRTQMLLLILLRPEEHQEILTIGEHYFKDLHGNWYMTSMFNKWLETEDVAEPDWFDAKQ